MRKTTKFLFGLFIGGSMAYLALKRMSPLKRQQLMNKIDDKMQSLKKNTIDYAFYADDTSKGVKKHAKSMADSISHQAKYFRGQIDSHWPNFSQRGKHSNFPNAASHLHSALNGSSNHDDIILNPNEAFHDYSNVVIYYPNGTMKNC